MSGRWILGACQGLYRIQVPQVRLQGKGQVEGAQGLYRIQVPQVRLLQEEEAQGLLQQGILLPDLVNVYLQGKLRGLKLLLVILQ